MNLYDKRFMNIKNEEDIIPWFKDDAYDLFEQNTTECAESETCIIKLKNKARYFQVTVNVSLVGAWQDVGGKLYTIDSIDEITYKEVQYEDIVSNFNYNIEAKIKRLKQEIKNLETQVIK